MAGNFFVVFLAVACCILNATGQDNQTKWGDNSSMSFKISFHPPEHNVVLVGHKSVIKVYCERIEEEIRLIATPYSEDLVKLLNSPDIVITPNYTGTTRPRLRLLGMRPGRTRLNVSVLTAGNGSFYPLTDHYHITVVSRVNLEQDAFLYVLCIVQFLALLMLGSRIRGCVVQDIVRKPSGIIAAVLCQSMFLPMVTLGSSLALSLRVHSIVTFLIVGCCPTAVLTPMFAVLQHGHVELAMVLLVFETVIAYGVMPFWLWMYGHFLGVAYHNISFPYFHITGAVGYTTVPIFLGFMIQKCAPKTLSAMDKAIHPTCLILTLTASTVSVQTVWLVRALVTWRLMLATAMVPLVGCIVGTLGSLLFRLKTPSVKTVAIATGLQNTILGSILVHTSYPAPDASLMAITVIAMEFTSLCFMYFMYIIHLIVWLVLPSYRNLHENLGVGGFYRSLAERIAKSMIKAGEITFSKRNQPSDKTAIALAANSPNISEKGKNNVGFDTLKGIGNKVLLASRDSMRRSQQSMSSKLDNDLGMTFFCSPDTPDSDRKSASRDSLSIDYEMLNGNRERKGRSLENMASIDLDEDSTRAGPSTAETYSIEGITALSSIDKGDLLLQTEVVNQESYTSRM